MGARKKTCIISGRVRVDLDTPPPSYILLEQERPEMDDLNKNWLVRKNTKKNTETIAKIERTILHILSLQKILSIVFYLLSGRKVDLPLL